MKNFIRGFGVGIIITTLIFAIAYMVGADDISDDEVISRAKKLGLVEEQSIFKDADENEEKQIPSKDETVTPDVSEPGVTSEGVQQEESADSPQISISGEGVTVVIPKGQDGISISYMLQDAGVVDDGASFNRYLSDNKLQMQIQHGTFQMRQNMTYEEVAQMIIGR